MTERERTRELLRIVDEDRGDIFREVAVVPDGESRLARRFGTVPAGAVVERKLRKGTRIERGDGGIVPIDTMRCGQERAVGDPGRRTNASFASSRARSGSWLAIRA
jgi:hypothetical protein